MIAPGIEKLHDFQQPAPPSWMPQTTAWYVLFVAVALILAGLAFRIVRSWLKNRYRRAALLELAATPAQGFSALLKRTALAAWPRETVASLSGPRWLKFLDESAAVQSFSSPPGSSIEDMAIAGAQPSTDDERTLRKIVDHWIRGHRVQA
jgi:Domain of unknown function (DUF4381)